ncbi:MAG: AAA family ATPase [Cyanobacteriota bacterium]
MAFQQELDLYLRARFTLIVVVTPEEERALEHVRQVCEASRRPCLGWDAADGFEAISQWTGAVPTGADAKTALEKIDQHQGEALFVLRDFHDIWTNVLVNRKLRNLAQRFRYTRKSILITTPLHSLPPELKDTAVVVVFSPPDALELDTVLHSLADTPGVKVQLTALGREKMVQAALGLTSAQAQRVLAKAIVRDGFLNEQDIDLVMREKKEIIRESQALEFYDANESPADLGGCEVLKDWLRLRERAFSQDARDYGLPAPRGMALIGIPGTGKSLTAKMIGALWHLPLLRLDVGSLYGALVGESEQRTRQALQLAETVAPCVLWIDELEKAFASGGLDGGTSTRVLGTILTWMQEKSAPCFVVATANDISSLPPELLRRGRFDEIFFLDLPTLAERRDILSVHLRKRQRVVHDYDIESLAHLCEGYVGAEIEQAIVEAMVVGFNQGREFTSDDIARSLDRQVPLSVSQRERITALRAWLREGRAQSASFRQSSDALRQFVPLDIPQQS